MKGLTAGGYFDEKHAALYFVDIMHGLAYLHRYVVIRVAMNARHFSLPPFLISSGVLRNYIRLLPDT